MERQHGHEARADACLAQASAHYAPAAEQVFADSFAELGWAPRAGAVADRVASSTREERVRPPAIKTAAQVVTLPALPVSAPPAPGRPAKQAAAQVAAVSLFPDNRPAPAASVPVRENAHADEPRPAFHFDTRPAPKQPAVEEMPPSEVGLVTSLNESIDPAPGLAAAMGAYAKSSSGHKGHASPSPSPDDGQSAASSPLPSPDASATPASKADATPSGTPSPAFVQKYEAATVQFLQKDYVGAIKLLDEADAIQGGQPQSASLRNQIFKAYYEAAYSAYQHADYPAALTQLDGADAAHSNSQNQSDAYNLRGLVLSKQRNYEAAETMFHKAVQTDPGLWAAKFNYAEVPFNYRNFTVARARFEELFSQTDPVKQPVEAELTQFKVFLTLLLEGKEDAARTFMQHFNFSGATPARYFCQAALNFYSGDVDKAQGWIDSARKEYPPRKSSSFLEAFYRVGWLTDPNAPENRRAFDRRRHAQPDPGSVRRRGRCHAQPDPGPRGRGDAETFRVGVRRVRHAHCQPGGGAGDPAGGARVPRAGDAAARGFGYSRRHAGVFKEHAAVDGKSVRDADPAACHAYADRLGQGHPKRDGFGLARSGQGHAHGQSCRDPGPGDRQGFGNPLAHRIRPGGRSGFPETHGLGPGGGSHHAFAHGFRVRHRNRVP